jgi:aryl-alcohol dehydrogenase-like predicted oxidoreductase
MLRGCGAVAQELEAAVHDNLRNLGLDVLDVVNMRLMFDVMGPAEGDIEAHITALATLQQRGLIRHIGLSNATAQQVQQAHGIADIVCVQNQYNLVHRHDDASSIAGGAGHRLRAVLPAGRLLATAIVHPRRGGC